MRYSPTRSVGTIRDVTTPTPPLKLSGPSCVVLESSTAPSSPSVCSSFSLGCFYSYCCCCCWWTPSMDPKTIPFMSSPLNKVLKQSVTTSMLFLWSSINKCNIGPELILTSLQLHQSFFHILPFLSLFCSLFIYSSYNFLIVVPSLLLDCYWVGILLFIFPQLFPNGLSHICKSITWRNRC